MIEMAVMTVKAVMIGEAVMTAMTATTAGAAGARAGASELEW